MNTPKIIIHRLQVPGPARLPHPPRRALWLAAAALAGIMGSIGLANSLRSVLKNTPAIEIAR